MDLSKHVLLALFLLGLLALLMPKNRLDRLKVTAEILVIFAGIYYGYVLSSSHKDKELKLEYLKVAIDILKITPVTEEIKPYRAWAVKVFKNNAIPPLDEEEEKLIREKPIPTRVMTDEEIQAIWQNSAGYQKSLEAEEKMEMMKEYFKQMKAK